MGVVVRDGVGVGVGGVAVRVGAGCVLGWGWVWGRGRARLWGAWGRHHRAATAARARSSAVPATAVALGDGRRGWGGGAEGAVPWWGADPGALPGVGGGPGTSPGAGAVAEVEVVVVPGVGERPRAVGSAGWGVRCAGSGSMARPARRPSAGRRSRQCLEQVVQLRACRAMRLRHSGAGWWSHAAVSSASSGQGGLPARARTTTRPVSNCSFIRCTRTAACRLSKPMAAASSGRLISPAASSHHSDNSERSPSSSQRVASATSRRWPESPSRRIVRSTKSAERSGRSSVCSSRATVGTLRATVQRRRTWFMAIATSQERNDAGSRRSGNDSRTRTMVSCTTSSTSAWPSSARPTTL